MTQRCQRISFFLSLCVILRRNHLRNLGYRFLYQQEMILSFHKDTNLLSSVYMWKTLNRSEYVTVSTVNMYGGFHGGYKQCHSSHCSRRWLVKDSLMRVFQTWGGSHPVMKSVDLLVSKYTPQQRPKLKEVKFIVKPKCYSRDQCSPQYQVTQRITITENTE